MGVSIMKLVGIIPAFLSYSLALDLDPFPDQNDNGMADAWCDVGFDLCISKHRKNSPCIDHKEQGQEAICVPHCMERFKNNDKFASFCKDHIVQIKEEDDNLRSVSHCPPGGCQSKFLVKPIWNYGCWCNFGKRLLMGAGAPVNLVDSFCRNLQLCLRCARWDGKHDPQPYQCDPMSQSYKGVQVGSKFEVDCSVGNDPNFCASHVCSCNTHFIMSLFTLIWDPDYEYDASYKHANGFDWDANCYNMPGEGETSCCGYYPTRYPYNVQSEFKQCCDEHFIFNPMDQCCSDNGEVLPIGTC